MIATATEAGLKPLREAFAYRLASVWTHVIDHMDGLDSIAFADAVGSFATRESNCTLAASPVAHPHVVVSDQSTRSLGSLCTLADIEPDIMGCIDWFGEGL